MNVEERYMQNINQLKSRQALITSLSEYLDHGFNHLSPREYLGSTSETLVIKAMLNDDEQKAINIISDRQAHYQIQDKTEQTIRLSSTAKNLSYFKVQPWQVMRYGEFTVSRNDEQLLPAVACCAIEDILRFRSRSSTTDI